jgi:hypothetical protein
MFPFTRNALEFLLGVRVAEEAYNFTFVFQLEWEG